MLLALIYFDMADLQNDLNIKKMPKWKTILVNVDILIYIKLL